jgi:hypothetical protein
MAPHKFGDDLESRLRVNAASQPRKLSFEGSTTDFPSEFSDSWQSDKTQDGAFDVSLNLELPDIQNPL